MRTITVRGGDSDVMAWCREHGLAPNDISVNVDVEDDGAVTLRRFVLDDEGRRQLDARRTEVLTEPVRIAAPKRPLPTS